MISHIQFRVLSSLATKPATTQRDIVANAGISLGSVNKAVRALTEAGLVASDLSITDAGREALEPFRVRGAIILAAGIGRRFAPLSFERPKALFRVRGEVLIERLIRQLREAGVEDIHVVVGPMKESFYYLEDKLGVKLVQTTEYATRNNHASLWSARSYLGNTYVCPADQYYDENLFHPYEYRSSCVAVRTQGKGAKQAFDLGANDLIVAARKDTDVAWRMEGPAYLDQDFADDYLDILEDEYNLPETEGKLWETIFIEHVDELHMFARKLTRDTIHEFDYLGDLCAFDTAFMENVDSAILDNICRTLSCGRDDITDVRPLDSGLTNLSVLFTCKGVRYVYRHPGAGTDEIINREAETYALGIASDLGLDSSFIYEDPKTGWKLSRFIEGCHELDYENEDEVRHALEIARSLHASGATSPWKFDFYDEAKRIWHLLEEEGWPLPADFDELAEQIGKLVGPMRTGAGAPVLCHNDFYGPNLLVTGDDICLIDWEYAAMGDYGCDFGNFIAQGSGYSVKRALEVLPYYFGREATDEELLHCTACVAVVGWYWYVWALFKECKGAPVGKWTRIWYDAAKEFSAAAQEMLDESCKNLHALTRPEFDALVAVEGGRGNEADAPMLAQLADEGLVNRTSVGASLTTAGFMSLEPYRARRAVFFAAGFGSRMLPITVNTPKPLVRVHGKRFIERLIDAVLAAGIEEIYVIRGYLPDEFDVLLKQYPGIRFIDNPIFAETNNISSAVAAVKAVPECFQNAYAFESDLYLTDPRYISKYQYRSSYLGFPVDETLDWYFETDESGRITKLAKDLGRDCWQMVGLSYWTAEDGAKLARDLPVAFEMSDENRQIFWDDVPCRVLAENYDVHVRECDPSHIIEIDSFAELQEVDPAYRPRK